MRVRVPVTVRWADLDAYGHVNNVEVLRLLEEARIAAFWRHGDDPLPTAVLESGPAADSHTFVAATEVEYLLAIDYHRDPLVVELWIGHLGGASIDVCYRILAPVDGAWTSHVQARTTIVLVDATTGRPRRLSEVERAAWQPYLEEPIAFRRRGGR